MPLERATWAHKMFHRLPHDRLQDRIHHVKWQKKADGSLRVKLLDVLDTGRRLPLKARKDRKSLYTAYYDLRTQRIIKSQGVLTPEDEQQFHNYIAQVRFSDGQYRNYPEAEWAALKEWLSHLDVKQMEEYFVDKILRYRPKDLQKYPFSPLKKLFDELKTANVK